MSAVSVSEIMARHESCRSNLRGPHSATFSVREGILEGLGRHALSSNLQKPCSLEERLAPPIGSAARMTLTFDEAIKSEFFSWFCLEPFGESSGPRRRFRPSGPAFRDLAEVGLKADGDAIEQAWLGLARSFIADGRNGPFARDMCRSFLQWAVREPSPRAKILIANIGRLDRGGPVIMRGPPPEPPEADTTGAYDVFMGHRRRASLEEDGVALENVRGPSPEGPASAEPGPAFPYGEPLSEGWLRIEVRLAPSTPAPWWRRFGFSR